jgi:hypothetical protein
LRGVNFYLASCRVKRNGNIGNFIRVVGGFQPLKAPAKFDPLRARAIRLNVIDAENAMRKEHGQDSAFLCPGARQIRRGYCLYAVGAVRKRDKACPRLSPVTAYVYTFFGSADHNVRVFRVYFKVFYVLHYLQKRFFPVLEDFYRLYRQTLIAPFPFIEIC